MLSAPRSLLSLTTLFVLFLSSVSSATENESRIIPLEPVWEMVDGEWKFKESKTIEKEILIHITSSRKNIQNKNLLIKELVKLPFVVIVEKSDLEVVTK
tara:strand:- start:641 stop:937 length:297 start_codon:yes stop_codon:yes gene_type:complete